MRAGPGQAGQPGQSADGQGQAWESDPDPRADVHISVVLPCLNEAASVTRCVQRAFVAIRATGLTGEVIVCDNGSTDGSAELAGQAGATVVHEPVRGYGSAYLRGFSAARGAFIVMGDADESYDFGEIGNLVTRLQDGYDYVVGSRFAGKILPGAMPWSHRYIGNPLLTGVLNCLFGTRLSDAHSGLRAMSREAYQRLALRCTGMELASEIAVRAPQVGLRTVEVPITYHPRTGSSKLRPLRDGWRHLLFMTGMLPGLMMILASTVMLAAAVLAIAFQPGLLRVPASYALPLTMLLALIVLVSSQAILLGAATSLHALAAGGSANRLSRAIQRSLASPALALLGPVLLVTGLSAALVSILGPARHGMATATHLRFSAISLATMMLGVQIWVAVIHLTKVHNGNGWPAGVPGTLALAGPTSLAHVPVAAPRPGAEEIIQRNGSGSA